MRKIIITLTLITLVFFAFTGITYSQVVQDLKFVNVYPYWEPDAGGKAIINYNLPNQIDPDFKKPIATIQAFFWGLNPEFEYVFTDVWSATIVKPNKSGNASAHLNIINPLYGTVWLMNKSEGGYPVLYSILDIE